MLAAEERPAERPIMFGKISRGTLFLLICPVAFAADDPFEITTKVIDSPAKGKAGKLHREQTFRGKEKIRDKTEFDSDGDGGMDFFCDLFYVDGECVYSMTSNGTGSGSTFTSHGEIVVSLSESKDSGKVESIGFLTKKGELREMFVRTSDGQFRPWTKEELTKGVLDSKALSPFLGNILDAIKDAKPEGSSPLPSK